jgi:hypothetical protein
MQTIQRIGNGFLLSAALALTAGAVPAQTSPTGQAMPPGTQNQMKTSGTTGTCGNVDTNGAPAASTDASCAGYAPGFATPSTNMPPGDRAPHRVTGVVRIDSVVPRPLEVMPDTEMSTINNVTMVKAKLPRLGACFSAGKQWSSKSGAATSTTCINHKGEVIAYQECKPRSGETPMSCTVVMAADDKAQESAKNQ